MKTFFSQPWIYFSVFVQSKLQKPLLCCFKLVTRQRSWHGVKTQTIQPTKSFSFALTSVFQLFIFYLTWHNMFRLWNIHIEWFASEGMTLAFCFRDTNSLHFLNCMYFGQVCFWLLKTVCNVSNDFHSHAFQLSLVLPLFFQNIVARFQKVLTVWLSGHVRSHRIHVGNTWGNDAMVLWNQVILNDQAASILCETFTALY